MDQDTSTDLLVIGAGPFGLSLAAYAQHVGLDLTVVGRRMSFWKDNMPAGMRLRSSCDWSLDPVGVHTIDAYLETLGDTCAEQEPLSLAFYLGYAGWFQAQKGIPCRETEVVALSRNGRGFSARLSSGEIIQARTVVLAVGMGSFAYTPADLAAAFPEELANHTCDLVEFERFAGQRLLIVGGRQSAFEWAALLREAGAEEVHLTYRHETPAFAKSDWTWVTPLVDALVEDPGWYRRLSGEEREALGRRFWAEGRLKLEPWLAPRIGAGGIDCHPRTRVAALERAGSGLRVRLDHAASFEVDHVVFATGYKADISRWQFLQPELTSDLETADGSPVLDEHFQSSVAGLYMTGQAAARDFGPFMGFTVSARASARIIGEHVRAGLAS